jgi:tungstate transport system permease protein
MTDFGNAVSTAFALVADWDSGLSEVVLLSLKVSIGAVLIASFIGLPMGAALALFRFPGRTVFVVILNAFMGLPPVVIGLVVYLLLSRAGPFGVLGLLFTPTAMIIAQVLLITPLIAALARQVMETLWLEYEEQLRSLGTTPLRALGALLWDGRFSLMTAVLAGFGRAIAEVGAVMIVGGNIDHVTRVMTTSIALEVSKGNLALALGLGIILVILSVLVNGLVYVLRGNHRQGVIS